MSKGKVLLLALVIVLTLVGVCPVVAQSPTPTIPTDTATKTLKVGLLAPHTGPNARVGEEMWDAANMAFETIGWRIGPYKVELMKIDDQSDPEKATRAYEEAVTRDKIDAGLMNWHSSVSVACMEIAAKYKVPHFFGFGATEVINEKYKSDPQKYSYWMGKTWPNPAKLSIAYVDTVEGMIKASIWTPAKKIAVVYGEDTDWGRSFGGAIREQLKTAGWTVAAEDYFAMSETEFYPLFNKWKNAGAVLLAGTMSPGVSYAPFIKQAREVKLPALIAADGLGWIGDWYKSTGDASDFVLDQIPQWTTPAAKAFHDAFVKKYTIEPSPSAGGQAFDMTNFFIKLARATLDQYQEITRETLYKVGQEQLWTGKLTYSRADGAILHEMYKYTADTIPDPVVGMGYYIFPVIQYQKGVGKIVWPDAWKEAPVALPDYVK